MTQRARTPRFRYPLEPFLKKHQWEEQALRQELATAREGCARLAQQRELIAQGVLALNAQLVEMHSGAFDPARRQRVIAWREEQEELLSGKQRELDEAQASLDQIAQQLARTLSAVRGHERYRGRLAGEHRVECEREAAREVDDAWLLRRDWLEKQA
jgi:hypothetical protein